jgi:hypothetical protein
MFKKLVKMIAEIETVSEFDEACGAIDRAFDRDKITPADHETLYRLLRFIDREALPDIKLGRRARA